MKTSINTRAAAALVGLAITAALICACGTSPGAGADIDADAQIDGGLLPDLGGDRDADGGAAPDTVEPPQSCARLAPQPALDFYGVVLGATATRELVVENCAPPGSGLDLAISSVTLLGDNPAEFIGDTSALWPGSTGGDAILTPGESAVLPITFVPSALGAFAAEIELATGDGLLQLPLAGDGVADACPIIRAGCALEGTAEQLTELHVSPGEVVICDASDSYDPDGRIVEASFEIRILPQYSRAFFELTQTGRYGFVPDVPTTADAYELVPVVVDNGGEKRCEVPVIEVWADAPGEIYAMLTWETPNDSNPNDTGPGSGTDLDLHLRHEDGCWNDYWDCYFGNSEPMWPAADGPGLQEVQMLNDDTDGEGPEVIALRDASDGVRYTFGIDYSRDWGFGPSRASLHLFSGGRLIERVEIELERTGDFWEAGYIEWPTPEFVETMRGYADIATDTCGLSPDP